MAYKMGKARESQEKASKGMGKAGGWPLKGKGNKSYCPKLVTSKSKVGK